MKILNPTKEQFASLGFDELNWIQLAGDNALRYTPEGQWRFYNPERDTIIIITTMTQLKHILNAFKV